MAARPSNPTVMTPAAMNMLLYEQIVSHPEFLFPQQQNTQIYGGGSFAVLRPFTLLSDATPVWHGSRW
jgi:hypothetical protein